MQVQMLCCISRNRVEEPAYYVVPFVIVVAEGIIETLRRRLDS